MTLWNMLVYCELVIRDLLMLRADDFPSFPKQNPLCKTGEGEKAIRCAVPTSFPRESVEPARAGGLTCRHSCQLTVAGQCRTCTGFAIGPSHPGEEAP